MTDTVTISREAQAAKQKLLARHMKVAELSKDPFFAYSDLSRELLEAAAAIDRLTATLASPPPPSWLREALDEEEAHLVECFGQLNAGVIECAFRRLRTGLASPDDGWMKVDESHPLPRLKPGDEVLEQVDSVDEWGAHNVTVAYRRRRSEQGE